jgi:hypothetical protein
MTRQQRFKYEMFVRVRDFGVAHAALFPETSKGGPAFARVWAPAAAVDEHQKDHLLGQAEATRNWSIPRFSNRTKSRLSIGFSPDNRKLRRISRA